MDNCYRVWMKDGYGRLVNADDEAEARQIAIQKTKEDCEGVAMSDKDRKAALTIDSVVLWHARGASS